MSGPEWVGAVDALPGVAVGAKVGDIRCPACLRMISVKVDGPWTGTLDDQVEAALLATEAECPGHGESVTICDAG